MITDVKPYDGAGLCEMVRLDGETEHPCEVKASARFFQDSDDTVGALICPEHLTWLQGALAKKSRCHGIFT